MFIFCDRKRRVLPWHAIVWTIILFAFSLLWTAESALAKEAELIGQVKLMPNDSFIGEWVIDDVTVTANSETQFYFEFGDFALSGCVSVNYVLDERNQMIATKMVTRRQSDCSEKDPATKTPTVTTPTATKTPSPTATGDKGDGSSLYGLVEGLPEEGFEGIWRIGGISYAVDSESRIEQHAGPIKIGVCVLVHYSGETEPRPASMLKSVVQTTCSQTPTVTATATAPTKTSTTTPSATATATSTATSTATVPTTTPSPTATVNGDENEHEKRYGLIERFPTELTGEWLVSGVTYNATATTEFSQEHGKFAVGTCVKVWLAKDAGQAMHKIQTTNQFRCGKADDDPADDEKDEQGARGKIYGLIQAFPADLIGPWQVGGITFVATGATEFVQDDGPFATDVVVKVEFVQHADETLYATEIETKFVKADDERDDNEEHEGIDGHAYGAIEQLPADLLGEWLVGGISYTVTIDTQLVRPQGEFGVDVVVRVKYRTSADGARTALQVKIVTGNGDGFDQSVGNTIKNGKALFFGYVGQMPDRGFVGQWWVDGVAFQGNESTVFIEEQGLFGVGGYVKIIYTVENDQNVVHKIISAVPPGAGEETKLGEIEGIEYRADGTVVWIIDGQPYIVEPATDLDEDEGVLTVGSNVLVNSYNAEDGQLFATRVRTVAMSVKLYLPIMNR